MGKVLAWNGSHHQKFTPVRNSAAPEVFVVSPVREFTNSGSSESMRVRMIAKPSTNMPK
jgi:hypothetical protein